MTRFCGVHTIGLHPLSHGDVRGAMPGAGPWSAPMTNGGDKHEERVGKKKASKKPRVKDAAAALKRKNMLPAGLDAVKKG